VRKRTGRRRMMKLSGRDTNAGKPGRPYRKKEKGPGFTKTGTPEEEEVKHMALQKGSPVSKRKRLRADNDQKRGSKQDLDLE